MSYEFRTRYQRLIPFPDRLAFRRLLVDRARAQGVRFGTARVVADDIVSIVERKFERETMWNRVRLRKFAVEVANKALYGNQDRPDLWLLPLLLSPSARRLQVRLSTRQTNQRHTKETV
jgi:hypothetical protein